VLDLYRQGLWPDLAQKVLAANYEWDLAYLYLARAAEGLGSSEAAITYYKLASASKTRCAGYGPSYCDGLDVSALVSQGLERLVATAQPPTQSNPNLAVAAISASSLWQRPSTFAASSDVRRDIEQMRSTPLKRTGWETDAEFQSRKAEFLAKSRLPRGYRVSIQLANPSNSSGQLVYYNLERGLITVALPSSSQRLFWEDVNDKKQVRYLHSSFIETDTVVKEPRTYIASNKLGASLTVTEMRRTAYGLAVLNKATEDNRASSNQVFLKAMERDVARRLLISGTLVLEVALDNRLRQSSDTPFVVETGERSEPTFEMPIDIATERYALPVRLLSVRLISDSGTVLFEAAGTEIDSQSLSK
jgi:hypothetical protein